LASFRRTCEWGYAPSLARGGAERGKKCKIIFAVRVSRNASSGFIVRCKVLPFGCFDVPSSGEDPAFALQVRLLGGETWEAREHFTQGKRCKV